MEPREEATLLITTKLPAHKSDNLALILDILDIHIDSRIKQKEAI